MDAPRHRILPPLAFGVPWIAGFVLTYTIGDPVPVPRFARWSGVALFAVTTAWDAWALWLLWRARTGILPHRPTTHLVTRGPFRVSRNPLYVGFVGLSLGAGVALPSLWAIVLLPVGVAAAHWGAILPEEAYLREKFGPEYEAYRARVRRWR